MLTSSRLVEVEVHPDVIIVVWHERLDDSRWRICTIIPFKQQQVVVQLYKLTSTGTLASKEKFPKK